MSSEPYRLMRCCGLRDRSATEISNILRAGELSKVHAYLRFIGTGNGRYQWWNPVWYSIREDGGRNFQTSFERRYHG